MAETMKAHCPTCDGSRVCFMHGLFEERWTYGDDAYEIHGLNEHRLLQCRGCETVFYFVASSNSEDFEDYYDSGRDEHIRQYPKAIITYPSVSEPAKQRPDWVQRSGMRSSVIDPRLSLILNEMYGARDNRLFMVASIALRTAFDRASELLNIDPSETFVMKVQKLVDNGSIGKSEAKTLSIVADAGSAAAHRGWSPTEDDFNSLLTVLKHFLERTLVFGSKALAVASSIPPKPSKKPKPPTT